MRSDYHWYRRHGDIRVYPTSEVLWYRSFSDITAPLISEFTAVISGYTDITALSCDIGLFWISGFQISYPTSQFQNSDIGTYTDVTAPDILKLFRCQSSWYHTWCFSTPVGPGFSVDPACSMSVGGPLCSSLNCIQSSRPASALAALPAQ
jgi:hypothetical protein